MRATVSFLVALLLITTPVTCVLAQAEQAQGAAVQPLLAAVAGSAVADAARVERAIIGVPQLEANSPAALLLAPAALGFAPAYDSLPPLAPTPAAMSNRTRTVVVLAVLGAALVALLLFVPCWECLGD